MHLGGEAINEGVCLFGMIFHISTEFNKDSQKSLQIQDSLKNNCWLFLL